ncbi:MAG: TrkA family potassium uptake protein [Geodermatophilaceae bacterium]|nr:TrkA family potassium uptake protein [Geodermatophilaceae bacterium]
MHIVVMGCGRVGSSLARRLQRQGHTVAVIDQDAEAFRRLGPEFTGTQVKGMGFDRKTLAEAGIADAGAFAAVSSGDNSNILAARVAREQFGIDHVVARIYDPKRAAVYERLGIPTVATVPWTVDRFMRVLLEDEPTELWRSPTGEVVLLQIPIHDGWIGLRLSELEVAAGARAAYLNRFGASFLPNLDTVVQSGDQVVVLASATDAHEVATRAAQAPERGL